MALTFNNRPGKYTFKSVVPAGPVQRQGSVSLIGGNVQERPEIVRDQVARLNRQPHLSSTDLTKVSVAAAKRDLQKTDDAIKEAAGIDIRPATVWFRFQSLKRILRTRCRWTWTPSMENAQAPGLHDPDQRGK